MKKITFDKYTRGSTFYMTDKNYKEFVEKLEEVEKRCKERTFLSVENALKRLYKEVLQRIKFFKNNETNTDLRYIVDLYESNDDYGTRCSYMMNCTKIKFEIIGKKIIFTEVCRAGTNDKKCYSKDLETIKYIISNSDHIKPTYILYGETYNKFNQSVEDFVKSLLDLGVYYYIV